MKKLTFQKRDVTNQQIRHNAIFSYKQQGWEENREGRPMGSLLNLSPHILPDAGQTLRKSITNQICA